MNTGHHTFGQAITSQLTFDQWLARAQLPRINPGPDGLRSLAQAQCGLRISEDPVDVRVARLDKFKGTGADTRRAVATQRSPLFRLPQKVRAIIFAYALTYTKPIPIRKHVATSSWYDDKGERLIRKVWRFTPPLLLVCDRVQDEAAPIFYAGNTFMGTICDSDADEITSWIRDTNPKYITQVKQLFIIIEPTCFSHLLDMTTASNKYAVFDQAHLLVKTMTQAGLPTTRVKLVLPPVKHMSKDALLFRFDTDDVEEFRFRWVAALEEELKRTKQLAKVTGADAYVHNGQAWEVHVHDKAERAEGKLLHSSFQNLRIGPGLSR